MSSQERASERRTTVRTGVVREALAEALAVPGAVAGQRARVVDIGGGTGGFAVPLAELGHQVLVVDPSPDALAALARRADECGLTDRVTGVQGDLADLADLARRHDATDADLVLCHGVLELAGDPQASLAVIADVLRPGGTLSLLVAQRHAAVVARAMGGHFAAALDLLDDTGDAGRSGRRFTAEEVRVLVEAAGFVPRVLHGVRIFADLVPSALLDVEPGAAQALLDLERAVADRPEYFALAAQLHLVATR